MKTFVTVALAVAAASVSSVAAAQYLWQAREAAQAAPSGTAAVPPPIQGTGSGLMIFIDPVTGQIRPPEQEDLRALARPPTLQPFTPGPQLFFGRDGVPGVLLDPSFDSYMVASKRPDGSLDLDCLPGKAQAVDAVAGRVAPTGSVQKKSSLDEK